jgi:hypothetical protein
MGLMREGTPACCGAAMELYLPAPWPTAGSTVVKMPAARHVPPVG